MKKLRKIFKEYEKISQKLFGNFAWAYSKPRATILEMRGDFASYRGIFQKALLIINEGHNQDQAKALKELKDQAKKASDERKDMINRLKAMDKKADERSKKSQEMYMKKIDDLVKMNQATPENRSKVLEKWLVDEKGANKEDAKSCASKALKEGRVPSVKKENKPISKTVDKEKRPLEGNKKADGSKSTEITKKAESSGVAIKSPAVKEGKYPKTGNAKPEQKSEPRKDKVVNPTPVPKAEPADDKKKPEKAGNAPAKKAQFESPTVKKDKGTLPTAKKPQIPSPKVEELNSTKAAAKRVSTNTQNENKTPKLDSKSLPPLHKPKVPVIVVQEINKQNGSTKDKDKRRSPSPTLSAWSSSSSLSNITVVGREKSRAASVSSGSSTKSQRERMEKSVRYVEGSDRRARSQDPPQNLAVFSIE